MMTHIYKVYRAAAGALLLTAALTAACTDDSREPMQENETPREGIFFSVTATQGEGAETRVSYTPNGDQGMDVTWADNDKIYVGKIPTSGSNYINSGILSPLDIVAGGVGQTTAQFDGTIANEHIPSDGTLYAFYGKADKIQVYYGDIRYYYDGQRQTDNGDMKHAAEYDFMTASTTYNATPGFQHHFSFSHVGSMMKFTLGGLEGQTVNKLTLSTYDGSRVFANGEQSVSLELGTGSGFLVESGKKLDAYLMVGATTETVGKNLVLYVTTIEGKNFAILLTGAEIAAGKLYTVDTTLTEYSFRLFQGAGTSGDPYKINDAGDLTKLAVMTNTGMIKTSEKYFELTADIDMKTGGGAWVPIGTGNNTFEGTFLGENGSGGNHSISNLPDKRTGMYAGLFGHAEGATIKNVTVSGEITISGANEEIRAGGIAGQATGSIIENCLSTCTINISSTGGADVGGIIGNSGGGNEVTECRNQGAVGSSKYSGGIIGYARGEQITSCTNNGAITSTSTKYPAGGIIGRLSLMSTNQNFTLTGCSHTGNNPTQGAAGSIIGSYSISKRWSGTDPFSTITIKDADGQTLREVTGSASQSVTGQWPEAQ